MEEEGIKTVQDETNDKGKKESGHVLVDWGYPPNPASSLIGGRRHVQVRMSLY